MMKPLVASLVASALTLSACADGGYGHHFGGGGGLAYDAYYDDAYGPYVDGYWGADDVFMYRHERNGEFARDEAHHFRHDTASGFHGVRTARAPAAPAAPRAAPSRPG
ncbi:hypothetical protein [Phenylobacterium sp.]|uniref:hypothetical protein n=1 Tax=Phenylobacterium sp. TaxID=1871053 RepID=UPI001201B0CF|nr:hypothetical protein [Phenylobacterium sp.]THD55834.1 MAG: hypothetical protein E8A12_15590 [Phenylobacterium sp.]